MLNILSAFNLHEKICYNFAPFFFYFARVIIVLPFAVTHSILDSHSLCSWHYHCPCPDNIDQNKRTWRAHTVPPIKLTEHERTIAISTNANGKWMCITFCDVTFYVLFATLKLLSTINWLQSKTCKPIAVTILSSFSFVHYVLFHEIA